MVIYPIVILNDLYIYYDLGLLIGVKGVFVRQIRTLTKCEITLVRSNYEVRKNKKVDPEPQVNNNNIDPHVTDQNKVPFSEHERALS